MKKYLFGLLIISLILAGPIYSQANGNDTDTNSGTATDTNSGTDTSTDTNKSIVPDSVKMDLGIKEQKGVMPDGFRGGDPDHSLVHVLEDVEYERHEHSLIYTGDAGANIASGSNFDDPPAVSWTTTKRNADGTWPDGTEDAKAAENTVIDNNNNTAACTERMEAPGEYNICNSGARDVSEPSKEEEDVGAADSSTSTGTNTGTDTDPSAEGGNKTPKKKTVTAEQNLGVIVHDCTVPDVWVAFKEGAGNAEIDMYAEGNKLENELFDKMKETAGEPFSDNASDFEEVSYLFIDEGSVENKERDKEPWYKTVRVTAAGSMFNESNSLNIENQTIDTELRDEEQRRMLRLICDENGNKTPCLFVRRNVPFVFAAASIDNGTDRIQSTKAGEKAEYPMTEGKEIIAKLENEDGSEISKQNGAYMFRVANYPRSSYKDQPNYYFTAVSEDAEGNQTWIKMPVYVINSNAAFETSAK